jgi:hypothetical protein
VTTGLPGRLRLPRRSGRSRSSRTCGRHPSPQRCVPVSSPLDGAGRQPATVNDQTGTTVGHENLRVGVGLGQATSHSGVLVRSSRLAATDLMAGYP